MSPLLKLTLLTLSAALVTGAWLFSDAALTAPTVPTVPAASAVPLAAADAPPTPQRTLDLLTIEPSLGRREVATLLADSDLVRAEVRAQGEEDVGQAVLSRLAAVQVSEADARAYYDQQRALFGSRSFEESRYTVEQLLAIERTRAELGLER